MLTGIDIIAIGGIYNIASKIYRSENKLDSAIICYHKLLIYGNIYGKRNAYRELSELSLQNGHLQQAEDYFQQYKLLDDSIRTMDKADVVARMHAAYNYSIQEKEAQKYKVANEHKRNVIVLVLLITLIMTFMILWLMSVNRERRRQIAALKEKRKELEQKNTCFIENIDRELSAVKQSIADVGKKDEAILHALFKEKRRLEYTSHIANIENREIDEHTIRIQSTAIYQTIQLKIRQSDFKLSEEEWGELETKVNQVYEDFTIRLRSIGVLSPDELHTSLLLKIRVPHKHIAAFICKTPQGETNLRKRLYDRFFHVSNGTAAEWDAFIEDL